MSVVRTLGALGLCTFALAACQPGANDPWIGAPPAGTVGSTLRQEQLNAARQDPGRAQQNPVATGVNPGVGGIERAATGGTGGTGAGAPVTVNPGVGGIERTGVGAPPTTVRRGSSTTQ